MVAVAELGDASVPRPWRRTTNSEGPVPLNGVALLIATEKVFGAVFPAAQLKVTRGGRVIGTGLACTGRGCIGHADRAGGATRRVAVTVTLPTV